MPNALSVILNGAGGVGPESATTMRLGPSSPMCSQFDLKARGSRIVRAGRLVGPVQDHGLERDGRRRVEVPRRFVRLDREDDEAGFGTRLRHRVQDLVFIEGFISQCVPVADPRRNT